MGSRDVAADFFRVREGCRRPIGRRERGRTDRGVAWKISETYLLFIRHFSSARCVYEGRLRFGDQSSFGFCRVPISLKVLGRAPFGLRRAAPEHARPQKNPEISGQNRGFPQDIFWVGVARSAFFFAGGCCSRAKKHTALCSGANSARADLRQKMGGSQGWSGPGAGRTIPTADIPKRDCTRSPQKLSRIVDHDPELHFP